MTETTTTTTDTTTPAERKLAALVGQTARFYGGADRWRIRSVDASASSCDLTMVGNVEVKITGVALCLLVVGK